MPARKGPKKVNRFTREMKRTAVRLPNSPGARVMDIAAASRPEPDSIGGKRANDH